MSDAFSTGTQALPADEAAASDEVSVTTGIRAAEDAPGKLQPPAFRPLLDLIPGMPSGQVCGPEGCAPGE